MLKEIAFTPQVFDEDEQLDSSRWEQQLDALARRVAPPYGCSPLIVSDLYGGSWSREVSRLIDEIKDHRARVKVQQIVTQLKGLCVCRPSCGEWPQAEVDWLREAETSHAHEAIERIVHTEKVSGHLGNACRFANLEQPGFWKAMAPTKLVSMSTARQIELLRPICVHASYIAIVLPHLRRAEFPFAAAVINSASDRPQGFRPASIDLHTVGEDESSLDDDIDHLNRRLRSFKSRCERLRLIFWPKFLEREVLAGECIPPNSRFRVKWGLHLGHPATADDRDSSATTQWSLYPRDDLSRRYRWFYESSGAVKPLRDPIVVRTSD
jgi:hypothetical protein